MGCKAQEKPQLRDGAVDEHEGASSDHRWKDTLSDESEGGTEMSPALAKPRRASKMAHEREPPVRPECGIEWD